MQYDEKILTEYAERLYLKAKNIVALGYIVGFIVGLTACGIFYNSFKDPAPAVFVGAVVGVLSGAIVAGRAFAYRFQAQNILVLCQIERNTRSPNAL